MKRTKFRSQRGPRSKTITRSNKGLSNNISAAADSTTQSICAEGYARRIAAAAGKTRTTSPMALSRIIRILGAPPITNGGSSNHAAVVTTANNAEREPAKFKWRRGRDSNPRYTFRAYTRFPSERLQPLGHPSTEPAILGLETRRCQSSCPGIAGQLRVHYTLEPTALPD